MPLAAFFDDQLQTLRTFMEQPQHVVQVIEIDAEFRPILLKMLIGLDEQMDFPHILIGYDGLFAEPKEWFRVLQDRLEEQWTIHSEELAGMGISTINQAKDPSTRGPWPFLLRAEQIADALPDNCGSLVFLIDPQRVDDAAGFARSIEFLADNIRSRWLKLVVLDQRQAPRLADLADEHRRIGLQTFWCSPQELEKRLDDKLAAQPPGTSPDSRRVAAMAAAVASANKDYPKAVSLQQQLLDQAISDGTATEQAAAVYGLGSTLLAAGEFETAAERILQACQLCSEHGLNDLAPMAYTNLGIALHRLSDFDQAFAALRVGSAFYRAQGNLPGEAFVCDNLALIYQQLGRPEDAARAWNYALGCYDSITNPAMSDVREAGRGDILAKLERLGSLANAA